MADALLGAVAFTAVAGGLRSAEGQTLPSAPETLKPPAGEHLQAHVHASGQQIYVCDGSKWILSRPDAKLFDEAEHEVGSHFAGPTWRWSDGSQVTGRPIASATPDPESIPWLLLTATGHTGDGVLKNVSSIQRLHTKVARHPLMAVEHRIEVSRLESLILLTIIFTYPIVRSLRVDLPLEEGLGYLAMSRHTDMRIGLRRLT
jgi:Protein of unknown function (DUF3455)